MAQDTRGSTRRGRPSLPEFDRRSEPVVVRLTPEEYGRVDAIARRSGLTVSALFRSLIIGSPLTPPRG